MGLIDELGPKRIGGKRWREFKKQLILERGVKCERCGKKTKKLIGDHIIPIALGGFEFDKKNVQLLCKECNKKKTSIDLSVLGRINLNWYS